MLVEYINTFSTSKLHNWGALILKQHRSVHQASGLINIYRLRTTKHNIKSVRETEKRRCGTFSAASTVDAKQDCASH